jgi:general secretion pathway protein L
MTTLIVTLPLSMPDSGLEYDYVLTPDDKTITRFGRVAAPLLPPLSKAGSEVVAVVPAQALSWHRVEIPKGVIDKSLLNRGGQSARLRAVLEGLLEEQLLDDPGNLHFALAPDVRAGQPVWVAVCDRAWLRACMQALDLAQHPVARIVPEFAPDTNDSKLRSELFVTQAQGSALLVVTGAQGVTVLPPGATAVALLSWPETDPIVAEPGVAVLAEQLFKRQASLLPPAQRWLQAAQSAWNLAQFDMVSSSHARTLKKLSLGWASFRRAPQWRAARWAVWLLLATHVLGLNAWAWKEKTALESKRAAIRNTLLQTFPDVRVVVDAPLQMEREVSALQQAAGAVSSRDLEGILLALSAVTSTNQTLTAIEFVAGEARLKGLQLRPDESEALATRLSAHGYRMRVEGQQLLIRQENAR